MKDFDADIDTEEVFANIRNTTESRRAIAQEVYNGYDFELRVESGDPGRAWFPTFLKPFPVMSRKLTVFPENGSGATSGWFNVEFDTDGKTVTQAYATVGTRTVFGSLPDRFLETFNETGEFPSATSTRWRM